MYAKYRRKKKRRKRQAKKQAWKQGREKESAQREHATATKNEKNGSAKRYSNAFYLSASQPRKGRLYLNEWQSPTNAKNIIILLLFFGAGVVRIHSFFLYFFLSLPHFFPPISFRFARSRSIVSAFLFT